MGYKIIAFQNCTKWANETPTIVVTINDKNWDEILQNYLKGNNPTNDKEWKKGVFAITEEKT